MSHAHINGLRRLKPLAVAVMAAGLMVQPATAATFKFSEESDVTVTFDTIFSIGALVRTQDPDKRNVGIVNGGTSRSVNEDDGNLNYKRGELVSLALKGLHDLDISNRKTGFFARFGYVSDFAARNKDELSEIAHKRLDFDMELFDAFLRHEFDVGGRRLNVRLGSQVVSWGESTFILGGINAINPIDVVRFRTPGSELKEAFIPVPMLWASQQVTDDITVEGFYQFKFEPFRIDPAGSYFSTSDVFGEGGRAAFTGFGRTPDFSTRDRASRNCADPCDPPPSSVISRGEDREARDDGQYGMAVRWFTPFFGNTELGFYAMNYHSRIPLGSAIKGSFLNQQGDAQLFIEYPEDIQLYGISFNSPGPFGLALQGEYSYRPNLPLQKAGPELSLAALGVPNQAGFGNDVPGYDGRDGPSPERGDYLRGFERVPMHQFQFTALKAIPNLFGASQVIGLFEAAFVHLQLPDGILFNGPGVYLPGESSGNAGLGLFDYPTPLVANGSAQPRGAGYATRNSWTYRAVTRFEYNNVFAGVNLLPRLVFSHDVNGVSPFMTEGVKAISAGVNATYNQVWSADVSYTAFFGGKEIAGVDCQVPVGVALPIPGVGTTVPGSGQAACNAPGPTNQPQGEEFNEFRSIANPNIDRDFVAASISYAF